MKYCNSCGREMKKDALICVKCGASSVPNKRTTAVMPIMEKEDDLSFFFFLFGFFYPLFGFIIWLVSKNSRPKRSKGALIGALIPTIVNILCIIGLVGLFFVFREPIMMLLEEITIALESGVSIEEIIASLMEALFELLGSN